MKEKIISIADGMSLELDCEDQNKRKDENAPIIEICSPDGRVVFSIEKLLESAPDHLSEAA